MKQAGEYDKLEITRSNYVNGKTEGFILQRVPESGVVEVTAGLGKFLPKTSLKIDTKDGKKVIAFYELHRPLHPK